MRVHRGVPGRPSQVLAITVGDMLARLWVTESLSEPEIDHVYIVLLLANPDQKVVRFDVSVQEVTRVDELNALKL